MRHFRPIGRVALLTLLAACGRVAPVTDADLGQLADYQRARKAAESGDFHAAAGLYDRVLRVAPDAARVRLELGLLYDEKMGDPITAIYYYRQYLALQPDSGKKQLVEDFVERAKLSLAAKGTEPPSVDASEVTRLQTENAALRGRIAELEKAAAPGATPEAVTTTPPTPPSETHTHLVQKGDTLQSLALRYYGTRSAWEKIYAANRAILPSKDQLKIGQQLVIP